MVVICGMKITGSAFQVTAVPCPANGPIYLGGAVAGMHHQRSAKKRPNGLQDLLAQPDQVGPYRYRRVVFKPRIGSGHLGEGKVGGQVHAVIFYGLR